jgi:hypothetical protein
MRPWRNLFRAPFFALCVLLICTRVQAQTYYFGETALQTGKAPTAICTADLNSDRRLDLAVANKDDGTISVLISRADGSFAPPKIYSVGRGPVSITAADFNGDGIPDLAVVNSQDNTVSILLGLGDGTFQSPQSYGTGAQPTGIVAADFDGDKRLDLAVIDQNDQTVSVFLGKGDGTFGSAKAVGVTGSPIAIVTADFTGDGEPDLAVIDGKGNLSLLVNDGSGGFSLKSSTLAASPGALATGDFNGDGLIDLVVTDMTNNQLILLLGDGKGAFQTASITLGVSPMTLQVGDFNGDGKLDLVVTSGSGFPSTISILLGNGNGSFQNPIQASSPGTASAILAGDFNNDNNVDLAALDPLDQLVVIFLGQGDGRLGRCVDYSLPASGGIAGAATADVNGDGKPDIVVAQFNQDGQAITGFLAVLPGNGDGTFQAPLSSQEPNIGISQMIAANFTADGKVDVATSDAGGNGGISLAAGDGNGMFATAVTSFTGATGLNVQAITGGDFNKDGKLDLALVALDSSNTFSPLYSMISQGDSTFEKNFIYNIPYISSSVTAADFNHDGNLDLAVAATVANQVLVFLGRGDGTFQSPTIYNTGTRFTNNVNAADFNGDGNVDLAVGTEQGVLFYPGKGDGTFQAPVLTAMPFSIVQASTVLLAASKPGLTVLGNDKASVFILPSNSDGTFRAPIPEEATFYPRGYTAGDLNGDGSADLILFSSANTTVASTQTASVLLSTPTVSFSASKLDFGTVNVGVTSPTKAVSLTNQGNAPLTIGRISIDGSFQQTNDCGSSLSIREGCALNVSFSPTADGLSTGTISFTDNASPQPQVLKLAGWSGPPDFFLGNTSGTASVSAGGTASFTVTIGSGGGFSGLVQLTCDSAPAKASCVLPQGTIALNNSEMQLVQISVTTTSSSSALLLPYAALRPNPFIPAACLSVACLILMFGTASQRVSRLVPLLAMTLVALLAVSCGGGSSTPLPPPQVIPGTPPGSYTLVLHATSGGRTHTVNLMLNVT